LRASGEGLVYHKVRGATRRSRAHRPREDALLLYQAGGRPPRRFGQRREERVFKPSSSNR
jgi:hypothetical protein